MAETLPMILPGERVTDELIERVRKLEIQGFEVQGVKDFLCVAEG